MAAGPCARAGAGGSVSRSVTSTNHPALPSHACRTPRVRGKEYWGGPRCAAAPVSEHRRPLVCREGATRPVEVMRVRTVPVQHTRDHGRRTPSAPDIRVNIAGGRPGRRGLLRRAQLPPGPSEDRPVEPWPVHRGKAESYHRVTHITFSACRVELPCHSAYTPQSRADIAVRPERGVPMWTRGTYDLGEVLTAPLFLRTAASTHGTPEAAAVPAYQRAQGTYCGTRTEGPCGSSRNSRADTRRSRSDRKSVV